MEFVIENYLIFLILAIVLLLGLFGYMMDRKRYEKYRKEIINEERVAQALEVAAPIVMDQAMPSPMDQASASIPSVPSSPAPLDQNIPSVDPMTGAIPSTEAANLQIPNN